MLVISLYTSLFIEILLFAFSVFKEVLFEVGLIECSMRIPYLYKFSGRSESSSPRLAPVSKAKRTRRLNSSLECCKTWLRSFLKWVIDNALLRFGASTPRVFTSPAKSLEIRSEERRVGKEWRTRRLRDRG